MSGLLATAKPYRIKAAHRRRRKFASGPIVQRYYDPTVGRFLSVDPVTADGNTGGNFNRYKYANNNPYRFTDPDGRRDWDSLSAHSSNFTSAGSGFSAGPPSVRAGDNAPRGGNRGGADKISQQRITQLNPKVQGSATNFISQVKEQTGTTLRVVQGLRTNAEQDAS